MGQIQIWRGLGREVRAAGSRLAFERARQRHAALHPYPDLAAAVAGAAARRREQRDGIVAALVHEYRESRESVWSAAAILAMAPLLASLERVLKNARPERNDAKSIVLAAFLEALNRVSTKDRAALRLYSETRRRVLRARRTSLEDRGRRSSKDVDAMCSRAEELSIEAQLDRARFVRHAATMAPKPGERPAAYVERLAPSTTRRGSQRRSARLGHQRSASLADLREAFRSICQPQPDGETDE